MSDSLVSQTFCDEMRLGYMRMSERTRAGLASARARGRKGGARYTMTAPKLRLAIVAIGHSETKIATLCAESGLHSVADHDEIQPFLIKHLRQTGLSVSLNLRENLASGRPLLCATSRDQDAARIYARLRSRR